MDEAAASGLTGDAAASGGPEPGELQLEELAAHLRSEMAIGAAGIGTFDWDLVTGELDWDDRLIEMFGYDADTFDRSIEGFNDRLHADDLLRVTAALKKAIDDCGDFEAIYRVCRPDTSVRWISARGRALCDPHGEANRLLGAAYDITDQIGIDLGVTRVLEAMPAGFFSLDHEWRFTYVNAEAERLLGRPRGELLGDVIWTAFPAANGSSFEEGYRQAMTSRESVLFDAYYPPPLDGWYEVRAWPSPEGLSVYFLEVTARRRAEETARRAGERSALLAQASRELAGSLTTDVATTRLPQLAVPVLADGCIVSVLGTPEAPAGVGAWHEDAEQRDLLSRYASARLAALPTIPVVSEAFQTGEHVTVLGAAAFDMVPEGIARTLLDRLAPEVMIGFPLRARGRTLGLLTLLFGPDRQPSEEDLTTAQDLADRAGLALDNARLYGQQRHTALQLQRSLLTAPPEPDHAEIVVRYVPASEAAAVGGDWYDAFMQRDGATVLVIGDVVGHDITAAATMGQLRSLLRGIVTSGDHGPAAALSALDRSMAVLDMQTLATAAVARLEQTDDERRRGVTRMRWSNAGHVPPVILDPEGNVVPLPGVPADRLLGVTPDTERSETVVTLDRGATVLLYTGGLVERRDSDLDAGLARLQAALERHADRPLQELCDLLLEDLVDGRPTDDVAIVAVRLHRQDRPRPTEAGETDVPAVVPPEPAVEPTA